VPELTLNGNDVKAESDQPTAMGMPKVVKGNRLPLFAILGIQARPIAGRSEVTSCIPLCERQSVGCRENEVIGLREPRGELVPTQQSDQLRRGPHVTATGVGLQR
jgi:hypothetical protein